MDSHLVDGAILLALYAVLPRATFLTLQGQRRRFVRSHNDMRREG